jgi:hypothetical protein
VREKTFKEFMHGIAKKKGKQRMKDSTCTGCTQLILAPNNSTKFLEHENTRNGFFGNLAFDQLSHEALQLRERNYIHKEIIKCIFG